MSSTMLAPSPAGQERMSQLLPTVKCSSCHQPVPFSELGEHTCSGPPPAPTLPKPSVPQDKVNNLLPQRLQGRVGSPGPSSSNPGSPPRGPPQHQRINSAASERLRVNTNTSGPSLSSGFRSSPLARSDSGQDEDTSPTNLTDPFRARPPVTADPRMRNNSLSSNYSSPITARPAGSPNSNGPPPMDQNRFPPSRNGTPQIPNSAPAVGLPSNPRSPNGPQPGRPSFNGMPPPITRNASPAPSHLSINRNQPSPAPSLNRNTGPLQIRGPPPMGPPPSRPGGPSGPPPPGPPPNLPPGGPPGSNAVPFPGGPPPPNGMGPGPEGPPRPPFGNGPQRSYTGSLPSTTLPGQVMTQPVLPYGQVVSEADIDTRTGGEAGMAGVGRKGFAAVARAAMFATPAMRPLGPQPQGSRRPDAPRFLDIDAASRSTDTPPLSAGSGYSSHSPGPTSPQTHFPPESAPEKMPARAPTPPKIDTSVVNPSIPAVDKDKTPVPAATTPASPFGIRLPFFEKLKNMVPGGSPVETTPTTPQPSNMQKEINHIERSTPTPTPQAAPSSSPPASEASSHVRSISMKSSSSSRYDRVRDRPPVSPTSGSDYSGLAYEASTDYGDDARSQSSMRSDRSGARRERELPPVPPLPSNVVGSSSSAGGGPRVNFAATTTSSPIPIKSGGGGRHSRSASASSSYSSASSVDSQYAPGAGGRKRTNSSAIAHALGLSQTPPRDYAKLGGPGVPSRQSRLERSASNSSLGSRSAYSRTASVVPGGASNAFDMLERTVLKKEEDEKVVPKSELVKSKSMGMVGRQRTAGGTSISGSVRGTDYAGSEYERGSTSGSASGSRAHRSNTVQGVLSSPDGVKAPKLPVRAKTTTAENANASGEGRTKERRRKEKVCVKCRKMIDDGRWIQVDTGSILCERCWKNMYLPKCRRCHLPIEKQAVSSSDGQLKGKYHKECFNCHTCHKPFPDKTFYVFDGKPFCAYHYHEANDSLCAAARCGQPIEGPCAVSHAGDRYHPDCMTCEYPGYPDCRERLTEYFEVDGRMLCERHAMSSGNDDEDDWEKTTKATRRVTRFIDLAGGNNNSGGGGGGDDGDSALR